MSAESSARRRAQLPERFLLYAAKHRAKSAGVPFDLIPEDIRIPATCPVLGVALVRGRGRGRATDWSPSIDRVVPELGYVRGNVEVISMRANRIKNNATLEELEAIVDYLARRVPPKQTRRKVRNPA